MDMEANPDLVRLIEKAAARVGNETKLARAMGVHQPDISGWKSGSKTCAPADRARLAGFANEDAVQELVRATLEKTAGTLRGDQLRQLLGKSFPQIIAGIVFALLLGVSGIYGSSDAMAIVAFFVLFLYSTMYIMLSRVISRWLARMAVNVKICKAVANVPRNPHAAAVFPAR